MFLEANLLAKFQYYHILTYNSNGIFFYGPTVNLESIASIHIQEHTLNSREAGTSLWNWHKGKAGLQHSIYSLILSVIVLMVIESQRLVSPQVSIYPSSPTPRRMKKPFAWCFSSSHHYHTCQDLQTGIQKQQSSFENKESCDLMSYSIHKIVLFYTTMYLLPIGLLLHYPQEQKSHSNSSHHRISSHCNIKEAFTD